MESKSKKINISIIVLIYKSSTKPKKLKINELYKIFCIHILYIQYNATTLLMDDLGARTFRSCYYDITPIIHITNI